MFDVFDVHLYNCIPLHNQFKLLIYLCPSPSSLSPELICSGSRKKEISEARALVAYLAVEETGHSAADVARYLRIGRANVLRSIKRGYEI